METNHFISTERKIEYKFDGTEKFDLVTVDKSPFATEFAY